MADTDAPATYAAAGVDIDAGDAAVEAIKEVVASTSRPGVLGGIGFTVEFDIQLYFRRAKALQLSFGDDRALTDAVAAAVLD